MLSKYLLNECLISNTVRNQCKFPKGRTYSLSLIKYSVPSTCKQDRESPILEVGLFAGREVDVQLVEVFCL